ncbi:MAG: MauE/DoxX family redox-associated membrane protein [Candidatus Binataceae bacterium]
MVGGWPAGVEGGRTMTPRRNFRRDYIVIAVTLALATVFIYAGIDKIRDPLQFADSIYAFGILPAAFVNLLAMGLPVFEIACGLVLLPPSTRRVGALALALTSVVFFLALLSALLRGLTLDCGCFGSGAPSRPRMWLELGLDAVLFSGSLFVYFRVLEWRLSVLGSNRTENSLKRTPLRTVEW